VLGHDVPSLQTSPISYTDAETDKFSWRKVPREKGAGLQRLKLQPGNFPMTTSVIEPLFFVSVYCEDGVRLARVIAKLRSRSSVKSAVVRRDHA
jgi:hypothetical protein